MNDTRRTLSPLTSRERSPGGFTLIELLVVIVILGILSAVVVFAVRGTNDKGETAAGATDERIVRTALEVYCARNGHYPQAVDPDGPGPQPVKDAMQVLVDEKFLSDRSTYHSLTTGDESDFQTPFEGKCGTTPRHYKLEGPGSRLPPPPPEELGPEEQKVCNSAGRRWEPDGLCAAASPGITPTRAINLLDGKILAVGCPLVPNPTNPNLRSCDPSKPGAHQAEIFDPSGEIDPANPTGQGKWTPKGDVTTAPVGTVRTVDSLVLLEGPGCGNHCGKVLAHFSGGGSGTVPDSSTRRQWQLYNPTNGEWTPVGLPQVDAGGSGIRVRTTLLTGTATQCGGNCGKVLINRAVILPGGDSENPSFGAAVYELYDPKVGDFGSFTVVTGASIIPGPDDGAPNWGGSQSRLSDGRVLVVSASSFEAKLFNSGTAKFSDAEDPPAIDYLYREPALTLRDNRVLVVSWEEFTSGGAALYTPDDGAGTWQAIKNCGTCTLLSVATDGTVLAFNNNANPGTSNVRLAFKQDGTAEWVKIKHVAGVTPGYGVSIKGQACRPNCGKILILGSGPGGPSLYTPPEPVEP